MHVELNYGVYQTARFLRKKLFFKIQIFLMTKDRCALKRKRFRKAIKKSPSMVRSYKIHKRASPPRSPINIHTILSEISQPAYSSSLRVHSGKQIFCKVSIIPTRGGFKCDRRHVRAGRFISAVHCFFFFFTRASYNEIAQR